MSVKVLTGHLKLQTNQAFVQSLRHRYVQNKERNSAKGTSSCNRLFFTLYCHTLVCCSFFVHTASAAGFMFLTATEKLFHDRNVDAVMLQWAIQWKLSTKHDNCSVFPKWYRAGNVYVSLPITQASDVQVNCIILETQRTLLSTLVTVKPDGFLLISMTMHNVL